MQPILYQTAFAITSYTLFIVALSSVVPLNSSLSSQQSVNNATAFTNITSFATLNAPRFRCDGGAYRRNLRETSCMNAVSGISGDRRIASYGTRGWPVHFDIELPYRWISGMPRPTMPSTEVCR